MANYCKQSSLESVADAIRGRNGKIETMEFPSEFESEIDRLDKVNNEGSPSVTLREGLYEHILPPGRYTGGSVSVVPEEKTVTPKTTAQTVTASANKVLKKVTVNAVPLYKVYTEVLVGKSSLKSWSKTGLDFKPEGAVIVDMGRTGTTESYRIRGVRAGSGLSSYGVARSSSTPGAYVKTPITLGENSVSINAPKVQDGSNEKAGVLGGYYYIFVWGK